MSVAQEENKGDQASRTSIVKEEMKFSTEANIKSYRPKKHYFYLVNKFSQGLAVMITDVDINHRLVAKGLDASKTEVSAIITPNPTWVSMNDPAMNVLGILVKKTFGHLPILDNCGSIVGLLDIAK